MSIWESFKNLAPFWRMKRTLDGGDRNRALSLIWRGEYDDARRMLAASDHPTNAFQLACIELERGDFKAAEQWAIKMPDGDPLRAVVTGLIDRRSNVPGAFRGSESSWLPALEAAWEAAGRPDLRKHEALPADFRKSFDVGDASALAIADRVIWLSMSTPIGWIPRRKPKIAKQWAMEKAERSVAELVVAHNHMNGWFESKQAKAAAIDVVAALAEKVPENMYVQLAHFASGKPALTAAKLAELEAIVNRCPSVDIWVSPELYERFEHVARLAGSKSPEPLAYAGWCTTNLIADVTYLFSAFDALSGPTKHDTAELYVRIARRMQDDGSLISFLLGNAVFARAAKVLDRQDLFDELAGLQHEGRHYFPPTKHLRLDPQVWPLPTLHCEYLRSCRRNERNHYRDALRRQGVLKA